MNSEFPLSAVSFSANNPTNKINKNVLNLAEPEYDIDLAGNSDNLKVKSYVRPAYTASLESINLMSKDMPSLSVPQSGLYDANLLFSLSHKDYSPYATRKYTDTWDKINKGIGQDFQHAARQQKLISTVANDPAHAIWAPIPSGKQRLETAINYRLPKVFVNGNNVPSNGNGDVSEWYTVTHKDVPSPIATNPYSISNLISRTLYPAKVQQAILANPSGAIYTPSDAPSFSSLDARTGLSATPLPLGVKPVPYSNYVIPGAQQSQMHVLDIKKKLPDTPTEPKRPLLLNHDEGDPYFDGGSSVADGSNFSFSNPLSWRWDAGKNRNLPENSTFKAEQAAKDPWYLSGQGIIATPNLVATEREIPTLRKAFLVNDGSNKYKAIDLQYDYAGDWSGTEKLTSDGTYRMPATETDDGLTRALALGLVHVNKDGSKNIRLDDALLSELLVPGQEYRSNLLANILSLKIGDSRRQALKEMAGTDGVLSNLSLEDAFYNKQLLDANNLALPITGGKLAKDYFSVAASPLSGPMAPWDTRVARFTPGGARKMPDSYYNRMYKGIAPIWEEDDEPFYNSRTGAITMPAEKSLPSGVVPEILKEQNFIDKFDLTRSLGNNMYFNDMPANAAKDLTEAGPEGLQALLHEAAHAMTPFSDFTVPKRGLQLIKDYNKWYADNKNDNRPLGAFARLVSGSREIDVPKGGMGNAVRELADNLDSAFKDEKEGLMAMALGVDSDEDSRGGYGNTSLAEALRALHTAKTGWARHLEATHPEMSAKDIANTVQNPDNALRFFDTLLHEGNGTELINRTPADYETYGFPSTMAAKGREQEMARAISGALKLLYGRGGVKRGQGFGPGVLMSNIEPSPGNPNPKTYLLQLDSTQWKRNFFTDLQRKAWFDKIWPQVRNNISIPREQLRRMHPGIADYLVRNAIV